MNSQNLQYAYEILDNIFKKNITFSLGGYHSLVKQKILDEFRQINDIDINIIIDRDQADVDRIQERIVSHFRDIIQFGKNNKKDYILQLNTEPERDYYKKRSKDDEGLCEAESDVCFSISLTTRNVKINPLPDKYKNNNVASGISLTNFQDYYDASLLQAWDSLTSSSDNSQRYYSYQGDTTAISQPTFSTRGYGILDAMGIMHTSTQKPQNTNDARKFISSKSLKDFVIGQIFDKLVDLILSNNNELTIDFFFMDFDSKHNQICVINGENYTSYYPILKAKYRYCTEKFTPEESFKKHIRDLSLSFNTKRIKGLNYPEDIELLIKNWEEMHEKHE